MTNTGVIHGPIGTGSRQRYGCWLVICRWQRTGLSRSGRRGDALECEEALKFSFLLPVALTNVGTLYAGRYQYVKFYVSQSGTTAGGGPVYWQDPDNFVVTPDVATGNLGFAGVALNLVPKGNYGGSDSGQVPRACG